MSIYLIRHGEAAASWQHNSDPGLSEKGREQAKTLPDFFEGRKVDTILSSPLLRAQETALPLSQHLGLEVTVMEAFREIPTPANIPLHERLNWLRDCAHTPWPEADAVVLAWRAALLASLYAQTDHTVIFSHFMVLNAVVGHLRDAADLVCYQPDYCSVVSLEYRSGSLRLLDSGREAQSRVL